MDAAMSEIGRSNLDDTAKRELRLLLANQTHLLVACVPGDVVPTLQTELRKGMFSSLLAVYAAALFKMVRLPAAGTQVPLQSLTFTRAGGRVAL